MKVVFPKDESHRYWPVHYRYVLNLLIDAGCEIELQQRPGFIITLDGVDFQVDFGDSRELGKYQCKNVLKFHVTQDDTYAAKPFPPTSFHDWAEYRAISALNLYNPVAGKHISMRQVAYAGAIDRRPKALKIIARCNPATDILSQHEYFMDIANTRAAVCIPGYSNHILDRGQLQYMAFGVCTVSPSLPEVLPYGRKLIPGEHYIKCQEEYGDLPGIIESLTYAECLRIGSNARKLFEETCTPQAVVKYLKDFS